MVTKMQTDSRTEYEIQIDEFTEGLRDLNDDLVDRNLQEFFETAPEEWQRVELKLIELTRMLSCLTKNLLVDMSSIAIARGSSQKQ